MSAEGRELEVRPLTREAFKPFGEVIETTGAHHYPINQGSTERYHDLCRVDVDAEGGSPLISIFRGQPFTPPIELKMVERHPLGSQAFIPMSPRPFLIVVAEPSGSAPGTLQAFLSSGGQGVNYSRNVWHHPLISLDEVSDFVVVDRGGPGDNLEEAALNPPYAVIKSLPPTA